jgi:hypothetical protein
MAKQPIDDITPVYMARIRDPADADRLCSLPHPSDNKDKFTHALLTTPPLRPASLRGTLPLSSSSSKSKGSVSSYLYAKDLVAAEPDDNGVVLSPIVQPGMTVTDRAVSRKDADTNITEVQAAAKSGSATVRSVVIRRIYPTSAVAHAQRPADPEQFTVHKS